MSYTLIQNGDSGGSVRTTINDLLTDINNGVYIGPTGPAGASGTSGSSGSSGSSGVSGDATYGTLTYKMFAYDDLIAYDRSYSTQSLSNYVEFASKYRNTATQKSLTLSSNSGNFGTNGVVAKNRSIYSTNGSLLTKYNPETGVLATFSFYNFQVSYDNLAYLPNDKIVIKDNKQIIGVWDTTTDTGVTYSLASVNNVLVPVSNTVVYIFSPYGSGSSAIKFNPTDGTSTTISFGATYDSTGWFLAKNNKIYSIPSLDTKVRALNLSNDTIETIQGVTFSSTNYKYGAGIMSLYDGCIYGWGNSDQTFLKINPDTNTCDRIVPNGTWSGWPMTYCIGQDIFGNIYCGKNQTGNIWKFDPSTNTLLDTGISVGGGYNASPAVLYFDGSTWFGTNAGQNVYNHTVDFKINEDIILGKLINYTVGRLF